MSVVETRRNFAFWVIAALGLVVQLCLVSVTLPLSSIFQNSDFFNIDHPFHLYQIEVGRHLLREGRLVGYDPFFSAGYVGGVTFNASAKVPMLLAGLAPDSVSTRDIYVAFVFLCALVPPMAMAATARVRGLSSLRFVVLTAIGLAYWWISALHWYHTAGMVSFVAATYCAIPFSFWIWQTCSTYASVPLARLSVIGLAGGAGLWLHPLFFVPVVALVTSLALLNWRQCWSSTFVLRGTVIAVVAILINLPWVIAAHGNPSLASLQSYQREVGWNVILNPLLRTGSDGMASIANPISAGVYLGSVLVLRSGARQETFAFGLAGVALLLFAGLGAGIGDLGQIQPNRFAAVGYLLVGLGAMLGLIDLGARVRASANLVPKVAVASVSLVSILLIGREWVREVDWTPHAHHGKVPPELTTPPPLLNALAEWIAENTTADQRILFESSLARVHDGAHGAAYLALQAGREFMGAPYPYFDPKVSFWDGMGLGRHISEISPALFERYLDLYGVGWVVAHSPELVDLLVRTKGCHLSAIYGPVRIFRVGEDRQFFIAGFGRVVSRGINAVRFGGVSGPEVVLPYHWVPGIASDPPLELGKFYTNDGFGPFVRVASPPPTFLLHMK